MCLPLRSRIKLDIDSREMISSCADETITDAGPNSPAWVSVFELRQPVRLVFALQWVNDGFHAALEDLVELV